MFSDAGLVSVKDFHKKDLHSFFENIDDYKTIKNKRGLLAFFENSSRTRSSFESAGLELGVQWVYFDSQSSSLKKGESLKDNFELFKIYPVHFVVLRHSEPGLGAWVYRWTGKPVINAGEGAYEHPTQALGDALCLYEKSKTKRWNIVFYGDLMRSRVARSTIQVFQKLGYKVSICRDDSLDTELFAESYGLSLVSANQLSRFDIVYALRTQSERGSTAHQSALSLKELGAKTLVMHAGPVIWGQDVEYELSLYPDRLLVSNQVEACYRVRRKLMSDLLTRRSA